MAYDLSKKADRDALAERISDEIDAWCVKEYDDGQRNHLGGSILADKCWRKLWYSFRWAKKENHEGRIHRLFQVGHEAEPRFICYLRGIGFEVSEINPETGKQWRITGCKGHYGGSLDGKCKAPEHYNIIGDIILLNEFKTNNTGKGFEAVKNDGPMLAKPQHWGQMCQYGFKEKIKYGLYMIENKNDSSLSVHIVELDWNLGAALERKAEEIIFAVIPPPRISENPDLFDCKHCEYVDICHHEAVPELNCRSCRSATPIDDGEWGCTRYQQIIPKDFIKTACKDWNHI